MTRPIRFAFITILIFFCASSAHAQGACPSGAPVSGNHCYFISSSTGSDSNNGASESTPWANAPQMSTCSNACAGHSYSPGEVYIFKGCDTWNFAAIGEWIPNASGTSGNLIYWGGFDQTWYNTSTCPSGWNRPIFSGKGTYPGSSGSWFMDLNENSYWRVAWIEWTGFYMVNNAGGNMTGYFTCASGCQGWELDHNYAHGFTFNLSVDCTVIGNTYPCTEPWFFNFTSTPPAQGEIDHNVFSGADTTGTCHDCWSTSRDLGLWVNGTLNNVRIDHNWFEYADCWVGTIGIFNDNTMNGCGPYSAASNSVHNNTFENNSDPSQGTLMYNNLLMHDGSVGYASVSQLAPPDAVTSYFFNNVIIDELSGYSGSQLPFNCASSAVTGPTSTCVAFNNTVEAGSDTAGQGPSQAPPSLQWASDDDTGVILNAYYNHVISSASGIQCHGGGTCYVNQTPNPNLTQTQSAANAQNYILANYFAPQNSSGATVQAGASPSALVSLCAAVSAVDPMAGTACLSSTPCGVSLMTYPYYNVGTSNCAPVARLTAGGTNNDAGAFQFAQTSGTAPSPPVGLVAVVH